LEIVMTEELKRIGSGAETPNRLAVDEPEFSAGVPYYEVFLNGALMQNALRADRKAGYVDVIRFHTDGTPVKLWDGSGCQSDRKFGVVQFVLKGDYK
jgi:hypothetical protein